MAKKRVSFHCKCNWRTKHWVNKRQRSPRNLFCETTCGIPWTHWLRKNLMTRTNESVVHSTNIYSASPLCLDQHSVGGYSSEQRRLSDTWRGMDSSWERQRSPQQPGHKSDIYSSFTQVFISLYYSLTMDGSGRYDLGVRIPGISILVLAFKDTISLCIKFSHSSHGNMHFCSLLLSRTILRDKCGQSWKVLCKCRILPYYLNVSNASTPVVSGTPWAGKWMNEKPNSSLPAWETTVLFLPHRHTEPGSYCIPRWQKVIPSEPMSRHLWYVHTGDKTQIHFLH